MGKSTYGILEKKITRCLAKLPSQHLIALVTTKEQVCLWLAHRCFQNWLALCWRARHIGEDDPLASLLESGRVDQDTYERVWLTVDLWEQLWGLIQLGERYIRAEFDHLGLDYPFKSAFELFIRVVWQDTNSTFSVCLKPYHEVSARKYEKAYRLAAKGCSETLNPIEESNLHGLLNQHQADPLLSIVIAICHQKATRKRLALKNKLEMFYTVLGKLSAKEATIRRKAGSFAWKDGKRGKGDKDGTYKFP